MTGQTRISRSFGSTLSAGRSGGVFIDEGADWVEATAELRKAYVTHPELDPSVIGGFV